MFRYNTRFFRLSGSSLSSELHPIDTVRPTFGRSAAPWNRRRSFEPFRAAAWPLNETRPKSCQELSSVTTTFVRDFCLEHERKVI
jgi:hypothetical protein